MLRLIARKTRPYAPREIGFKSSKSFTVGSDIRRRDEADSRRTASPLVTADGAQVLDTSELTVDGVVDAIVEML